MTDLVFEKITQTLAAAQRVPVQIAGNFLRMSVAPYPVSVSLVMNSRVIGTMRGMLAGDYVKDIEFDGVIIENGSTSQEVVFQIAGGGAGSDRVLGEVSVINGEIAKVKAGQAFIAPASCTAVAGQYSHCQLWNPAGSGKNLILTKVIAYGATTPQSMSLNRHNAALTTLLAAPMSKMTGAGVSVAQMRAQASAALLGQVLAYVSIVSAYESKDYQFSEPLIIVPGDSVCVVMNNVNVTGISSFQWNEEAI